MYMNYETTDDQPTSLVKISRVPSSLYSLPIRHDGN